MKMEEIRPILICRFCRIILRLTGIWPTKNEESKPGKKFYLPLLICLIPQAILFSFCVTHILVSYKANLDLSEDLAYLIGYIGNFAMLFFYVMREKDIILLLRDLSNFDGFGEPPGFGDLNNKHDLFAKIFLVVISTAIFCKSGTRIYEYPKCRERGFNENCGFVVPSTTPRIIAFEETPGLFISYYIFEIVTLLIYLKVPMIISYLLFEISEHLVLRIKHLSAMLLNVFDENQQENRKRLNECVAYHYQIIKHAEKLNKCFTNCMFIHLTVTGFVCATSENQIAENMDASFVVYITAWTAALFFVCLGGQNLIDASTEISDAAYNSKWYECELQLQKDLVALIVRSQRPLQISTGPFSYLSFPLFVAIMKASYTFFTLLQTL